MILYVVSIGKIKYDYPGYSEGMLVKYLKKISTNKLLNILVVLFVTVPIFCILINVTYATTVSDEPDVEITINTDGKVSAVGNIFDDILWYPGVKSKGVIRINNNYKDVRINEIGMKVSIVTSNSNQDIVEASFFDNMRLTVKRGKFLVFNDNIIDDKSFSELMSETNDGILSEIRFEISERYKILQADSMDLQYELYMDRASGNELQNLSANTKFLLRFVEE
jgi:hypothetical protein